MTGYESHIYVILKHFPVVEVQQIIILSALLDIGCY